MVSAPKSVFLQLKARKEVYRPIFEYYLTVIMVQWTRGITHANASLVSRVRAAIFAHVILLVSLLQYCLSHFGGHHKIAKEEQASQSDWLVVIANQNSNFPFQTTRDKVGRR